MARSLVGATRADLQAEVTIKVNPSAKIIRKCVDCIAIRRWFSCFLQVLHTAHLDYDLNRIFVRIYVIWQDDLPGNSTALMVAAWYGHTEVVAMLIAAGVDVNQTDSNVSALFST